MKQSPKVSVIIPVYNVAKYLPECLDSVCAQTLKDIEIICVNDGSTDNSPQILEEYAAKDSRIKVINQENGGYGKAVNNGLNRARGEFSAILESDDWVSPKMYETLYNAAKEKDVEVVKSNYFYYKASESDIGKADIVDEADYDRVVNPLVSQSIFYAWPAIWAAIYRTDFLKKHNIRCLTTPGASYQDISFNFKVWVYARRVYFLRDAFVHYRIDNEGASSKSKGKVFCVNYEYAEVERLLDSMPDVKKRIVTVKNFFKYVTYMWNLNRLSGKFKFCFIWVMHKEFKSAYKRNEIDRKWFSAADWKDFQKLIKHPLRFYYKISGLKYRIFHKEKNESRLVYTLFGYDFFKIVKKNGNYDYYLFKCKVFRRRIKKIKVALLINEYFGAMGTAFGGYGFLARRYIARYVPDKEIALEVILDRQYKDWSWRARCEEVDGVKVYYAPGKRFLSLWLMLKKYDLYMSIEITNMVMAFDRNKKTKLLFWLQDPRPWYDWREIQTVKMFPESCYWTYEQYEFVHRMWEQGRIKFISQANYFRNKALDLYALPDNVNIEYLPNPVDIDYDFDVNNYVKKDKIIFVGRIESVKRGWLFCEIAKKMPEYEFYMIGQSVREKEKNESIISEYYDIPNLHFTGHLEGKKKFEHIKEAKLIVNTSIHEALPVTFLEALAYGTLIVSCQNPDDLTKKFGVYTGVILGDGFDQVDRFIEGIRSLMNDDIHRQQLAESAVAYIREVHNVPKFQQRIKPLIKELASKW